MAAGVLAASQVVSTAARIGWGDSPVGDGSNGLRVEGDGLERRVLPELARRSSPGEMATVAGATQFITFFGSMAGPVVYGEFIPLELSYSATYLVLAALPVWFARVAMISGGRGIAPAARF